MESWHSSSKLSDMDSPTRYAAASREEFWRMPLVPKFFANDAEKLGLPKVGDGSDAPISGRLAVLAILPGCPGAASQDENRPRSYCGHRPGRCPNGGSRDEGGRNRFSG